MKFPKLKRSQRDREFIKYKQSQVDEIVYEYLFHGKSHRWLDENILSFDKVESRGWQAMNILHYLGLVEKHKGICEGHDLIDVIDDLTSQDKVQFKKIISSLSRFTKVINSNFAVSQNSIKLYKPVGTSQYTDGVRINKEFHSILNPQDSRFYVSRGKARKIKILFNNKVYEAEYRFENQSDKSRELQSIRFKKDLKSEFKKVFPFPDGRFLIQTGIDLNHFLFTIINNPTPYEDEEFSKSIIKDEIEGRTSEEVKKLIEKMFKKSNEKVGKKANKKSLKTEVYDSNPVLKEHVKLLYHYKCQICTTQIKRRGWKIDLPYEKEIQHLTADAHHVRPRNKGGKDVPENLICVCPNCHRKLHSGEYEIKLFEEKITCLSTISNDKFIIQIDKIHNMSI